MTYFCQYPSFPAVIQMIQSNLYFLNLWSLDAVLFVYQLENARLERARQDF